MLVYAVISYNLQEGIELYNIYDSVKKASARVEELKKISSSHNYSDCYDIVAYDTQSGYPTGQTYSSLEKVKKGEK